MSAKGSCICTLTSQLMMLFGEHVKLLDDGALLRSVLTLEANLGLHNFAPSPLSFLCFLSVIEYMIYQFPTLAIAVMAPLLEHGPFLFSDS